MSIFTWLRCIEKSELEFNLNKAMDAHIERSYYDDGGTTGFICRTGVV